MTPKDLESAIFQTFNFYKQEKNPELAQNLKNHLSYLYGIQKTLADRLLKEKHPEPQKPFVSVLGYDVNGVLPDASNVYWYVIKNGCLAHLKCVSMQSAINSFESA